MAYKAPRYSREAEMSNLFGIPPHDFVENTIDVDGNITQTDYYADDKLVATVVTTFETVGGADIVKTIRRTV